MLKNVTDTTQTTVILNAIFYREWGNLLGTFADASNTSDPIHYLHIRLQQHFKRLAREYQNIYNPFNLMVDRALNDVDWMRVATEAWQIYTGEKQDNSNGSLETICLKM